MNDFILDAPTYVTAFTTMGKGQTVSRYYKDVFAATQSTYFHKLLEENTMNHIVNNISLINLHISLWQGDKALKAEDLEANGVDVSKLPPGKLASLGCKRTIGKEATRGFIALKREAHTVCARYGVKFGESGYAVPIDKTDEICIHLGGLKNQFANEKANFMLTYEALTEEWINQNDYEWRDVIRKSVDPVCRVAQVLSFNFSAYTVNPVANVSNGMDEEVGGLHAQLCKEIRTLAAVTLKTSYLGKTQVGKRALRPLTAMRDKLHAMKFLDQTIDPLADEISDCLISAFGSIKRSSGNILEGKVFNETVGMLTKLSSLGLKTVYEEVADLLEEPEEDEYSIDSNPTVAPVVDIPDWDF